MWRHYRSLNYINWLCLVVGFATLPFVLQMIDNTEPYYVTKIEMRLLIET